MSRKNGDKSRFNRQRKQKMRMRVRIRELRKTVQVPKIKTLENGA